MATKADDTQQALSPFATQVGGGAIRIVKKGDLFPADHPVVTANPTRFGPVKVAAVAAYPTPAKAPAPVAPPATEPTETAATSADDGAAGTSTPTEPDAPTQGDLGGEPDLATLRRADLNALATSLGVADADSLPNIAAVIEAIKAAKAAAAGATA